MCQRGCYNDIRNESVRNRRDTSGSNSSPANHIERRNSDGDPCGRCNHIYDEVKEMFEFAKVYVRSIVGITAMSAVVAYLGLTDPTVIGAYMGAVIACVLLDQPTE